MMPYRPSFRFGAIALFFVAFCSAACNPIATPKARSPRGGSPIDTAAVEDGSEAHPFTTPQSALLSAEINDTDARIDSFPSADVQATWNDFNIPAEVTGQFTRDLTQDWPQFSGGVGLASASVSSSGIVLADAFLTPASGPSPDGACGAFPFSAPVYGPNEDGDGTCGMKGKVNPVSYNVHVECYVCYVDEVLAEGEKGHWVKSYEGDFNGSESVSVATDRFRKTVKEKAYQVGGKAEGKVTIDRDAIFTAEIDLRGKIYTAFGNRRQGLRWYSDDTGSVTRNSYDPATGDLSATSKNRLSLDSIEFIRFRKMERAELLEDVVDADFGDGHFYHNYKLDDWDLVTCNGADPSANFDFTAKSRNLGAPISVTIGEGDAITPQQMSDISIYFEQASSIAPLLSNDLLDPVGLAGVSEMMTDYLGDQCTPPAR